MALLVLLIAVVVVAAAASIANALNRRRLVRRIHDLGAVPSVDGLPGQASIDNGEVGRAVAKSYLDQLGDW